QRVAFWRASYGKRLSAAEWQDDEYFTGSKAPLHQGHLARGEHGREGLARQICVFALAQSRERVEPFKLRVDAARMAHDDAAVRELIEKPGKYLVEIGARPERIGAGEGRVGAHTMRPRALAERGAERIDQQSLGVRQAVAQRRHAAALAHPCARCG